MAFRNTFLPSYSNLYQIYPCTVYQRVILGQNLPGEIRPYKIDSSHW